jgi:hypothetical protein
MRQVRGSLGANRDKKMQAVVRSSRGVNRNLKCLAICGAALTTLAGYSSTADAQFTYSNTTTGTGLTVGTFLGGTTFNGTPVTTGSPTDGTSTTAGMFSAAYSDGTGSYTGSGSSGLTYNLDPTGIVLSSTLTGTATSTAADGNPNDYVVTVPSGGIGTDFMVATTGLYNLTGSVNFGGTAAAEFGGLFFTYTVNDDTDHTGFSLDDDLEDTDAAPAIVGVVNEMVTLTAGDRYTLAYGVSLNPASAAAASPRTSTITGSAHKRRSRPLSSPNQPPCHCWP